MQSITLSQLRHKKLWLPFIQAGQVVELRSRKKVIGHIRPPRRPLPEGYTNPETNPKDAQSKGI
ncbi:MAG: hypothetical protein ACLPY1_17725 [Terracidiphilus sp.]